MTTPANYAKYFDSNRSNHRAWLEAVLIRLNELDPTALSEDGLLHKIWVKDSSSHSNPVDIALPLIKEFEGCRLKAYADPETGSTPWTIGWGSTTYADGREVGQHDKISQLEANELLAIRVDKDCKAIAKKIPIWNKLNPNQQAALLSFTYNCGTAWYAADGFRTITATLEENRLKDVPKALLLYVNPGGPSEAGLRRRRIAEGTLWYSDDK